MGTSTLHLEIPASGVYLSVVRAAATGLAAQLQFTYEEIDDLRIAVDEACTQLLARRGSAETLRIDYHMEPAELRVDVSVEAPDRGWQILTALTDEVSERADDSGLHLSFRKHGGHT